MLGPAPVAEKHQLLEHSESAAQAAPFALRAQTPLAQLPLAQSELAPQLAPAAPVLQVPSVVPAFTVQLLVMQSAFRRQPPVAEALAQRPLVQALEAQSAASEHTWLYWHLKPEEPPQSMSVSEPFLMKSELVAAWQAAVAGYLQPVLFGMLKVRDTGVA